jgi:hypothetical protein
MSALGQKQTCAVQNGMSALPPKADIERSATWFRSRAPRSAPRTCRASSPDARAGRDRADGAARCFHGRPGGAAYGVGDVECHGCRRRPCLGRQQCPEPAGDRGQTVVRRATNSTSGSVPRPAMTAPSLMWPVKPTLPAGSGQARTADSAPIPAARPDR